MKHVIAALRPLLSVVLVAVATCAAQARFTGIPTLYVQSAASGEAEAKPAPSDSPQEIMKPEPSPIVLEAAVPLGGYAEDRQIMPKTVTVSPDSSTIAYRLRFGTDLQLDGYVIGGSNPVGTNHSTDPRFSPDSKDVAMVTVERGWKLKYGRVYTPGYEPMKPVRFSPDGKRMIYLAKLDHQYFVVEGDLAHTLADAVQWERLVFTPDSVNLAYPAYDGRHWRMVINGDPGPTWDRFITAPFVAEQGPRVVYVALKGGRYHVVDRHTPAPTDADSKQASGFRLIDRPPVLSADGKTYVYWALGDDLVWRVYKNHLYVPGYDAERPGELVISKDGQTLAAILKREGGWHVVNNGAPSKAYTAIGKGSLVLSPDASRLVYAVKKPRGWAMVDNGVEQPTYIQLAADSVRFSPDGTGLVYAALTGGRWSVIVDGQAHPGFNQIHTRTLTYSPDGKHLAYTAQAAGQTAVVFDGDVIGRYEHAEQLTFDRNSYHMAWLARDAGAYFLVVDGVSGKETFDQLVPGAKIQFTTATKCHTVVMRRPGPTFARIELKLRPMPDPKRKNNGTPAPAPAPAEPENTATEPAFVDVPTQ